MDEMLNTFLAYAPWAGFIVIVLVAYFATRHHLHREIVPAGQTFACNQCGHRDKRDHMVPVAREGSILWYCHRHAR